jgi:preprotein translocase subunit SecE
MATQTSGQSLGRRATSGRADKGDRTTPAVFVRQVVAELRKVVWPTRRELVTYTVAALVFCAFMVALVEGLDLGFTKLMFWIFR